jgi:predicted Fe-Mo cluster-binding NifX family protein
MRIAFPTRDDQSIIGHFGKMNALIVVDVVDGEETARERRDMADTPACGADRQKKPAFVVDRISNCDVLVAGGMGTHTVDRATEAGIEVVLTRERLIAKALGCSVDGTLADESQLAHSPT